MCVSIKQSPRENQIPKRQKIITKKKTKRKPTTTRVKNKATATKKNDCQMFKIKQLSKENSLSTEKGSKGV